jgi:hypothetical protein
LNGDAMGIISRKVSDQLFKGGEGVETGFWREFQVVFLLLASGLRRLFSLRPSELAWYKQSSTLPPRLLAALFSRRLETLPNRFSHTGNR